jgi:transposase-like protein
MDKDRIEMDSIDLGELEDLGIDRDIVEEREKDSNDVRIDGDIKDTHVTRGINGARDGESNDVRRGGDINSARIEGDINDARMRVNMGSDVARGAEVSLIGVNGEMCEHKREEIDKEISVDTKVKSRKWNWNMRDWVGRRKTALERHPFGRLIVAEIMNCKDGMKALQEKLARRYGLRVSVQTLWFWKRKLRKGELLLPPSGSGMDGEVEVSEEALSRLSAIEVSYEILRTLEEMDEINKRLGELRRYLKHEKSPIPQEDIDRLIIEYSKVLLDYKEFMMKHHADVMKSVLTQTVVVEVMRAVFSVLLPCIEPGKRKELIKQCADAVSAVVKKYSTSKV